MSIESHKIGFIKNRIAQLDVTWVTTYDVRSIGSALRRLTDSRKFWSKRQGLKGYINYVSSFLEENALSDPLGTIHYTIMARS